MKSTSSAQDAKKRLKFPRFNPTNLPFSINNGSIYSFAINEVTNELLYADNRGIHLMAIASNEEIKSISYTDLIKQEISRYSDRKQQEIVQSYSSHGVQYLNVVQTQNIWLGVVSRKKFVFLSEDLAVSNESPIDTSGITAIKVLAETGDILTLTGDGKVIVWVGEVITDTGKKRPADFDVKIMMKKKFPCDSLIVKVDVTLGEFPYVAGIGDSPQNGVAIIHLWDFRTGEALTPITHSEGYGPLLITAIGLRDKYLVFIDSARNIVVHDLLMSVEVYRRNLGMAASLVDTIQIEDRELNAGIYLIDSAGRVYDYSVTNDTLLSAYIHSRSKDKDCGAVVSPRTTEKSYLSSMRANQLDEKAAPGTVFSRFNTCFRIITQSSGLTQLWALFDGTLNVLGLASIGKIVDTGGGVVRARRVPYTAGALALFESEGLSELMEVQMETGTTGLVDILVEKPIKLHSDFVEVVRERGEVVGISRISLDFGSIISISESGGLLCFDYKTKHASQDYQLSKIIVTALCIAPKYAVMGEVNDDSNHMDIIVGTDSGVILVFEYDLKKRVVEGKKRYAGHDVVVHLEYRSWDRRVLTVGRDGYLKFLLCDRYYEWDLVSYKGYWNDCTACALCGRAMVLLGYESGMLQTLYFSPSANYPTSSLLEYHTTSVTSVCGLDLSLSEGVSGDNSGNIVLWNLETSEPAKVFMIYSTVQALIMFGSESCESLFTVFNHSLLKLQLDRSVGYRKTSKKDLVTYKTESKKRRLDQKKKVSRPTSLYGTRKKIGQLHNSISDLYTRVSETKDRLIPDPVEVIKSKHQNRTSEDDWVIPEVVKTVEDRNRERALHQIIESNHIERFKKSLAITVKHCNQWIPRELQFSGRFKARSLIVTPSQPKFPNLIRLQLSSKPGKRAKTVKEDSETVNVYMTRSPTHMFHSFASLISPKPKSRVMSQREF